MHHLNRGYYPILENPVIAVFCVDSNIESLERFITLFQFTWGRLPQPVRDDIEYLWMMTLPLLDDTGRYIYRPVLQYHRAWPEQIKLDDGYYSFWSAYAGRIDYWASGIELLPNASVECLIAESLAHAQQQREALHSCDINRRKRDIISWGFEPEEFRQYCINHDDELAALYKSETMAIQPK